jgi:Mrp family chromosome partitioning ATPase
MAGKRVVVLSADLRRPGLQRFFDVGDRPGLTDVLRHKCGIEETLSPSGTENLWILHAGSLNDSVTPAEILTTTSLAESLSALRRFADFVLVDTPPVVKSSDVAALAPLADGILFVVDPQRVERGVLRQAQLDLRFTGVPVIGIVVTRYDPRRFRAYGSGYGYRPAGAIGGVAEAPPNPRDDPFSA